MDKIEQINKELADRVMPDIEYIALLNTKVIILREELEVNEGLLIVAELALEKLRALADKRLELLKEIAEVIELWDMGCPICGGWNHRKDCELAEAIDAA